MQTLNIPKRLASFEKMQQSNWKTQILSFIAKQKLQPSYEEYLSLNQALQQGDEPMDKLLQWIMQNPKQHRSWFETALYKGLDHLPHEIPELKMFFEQVETPPAWVDQNKMQEAIQFTYRLGINSGFVLRDLSLMMGYLFPGFNQPLILTGALNKQANKRLAETTKWWIDITEPNAFDRFNKGFTSTIYVRFIHSLVRHHLAKSEKWDSETWGLPINQYDQAMTNIAFSGVLLLGVRALGILPTKKEIDSFLHFWKYAGWLMGIDEKWLVNQEADGWRFLYWMTFAHPNPDETSLALGSSLSKEPFERPYTRFTEFNRKLAYRQHLSVTQFFLSRQKMKKLGLEHQTTAWFAYYLLARNVLVYTGARHSQKLDEFLQKNGRQMQKLGFTLYQGDSLQLASMHQ
ncbi:oxygenase MpaB family protein [Acinetobacter stercoris]|uniref:Latex clearing protein n=1 Tax=Acinetobacter stercoris TaxID=2126983 RepID=A0A2U3N2B9_9GAMM|nr:oxygenase MpaB family protein [Acinetobacter stercoris]SPL71783.1 Latex clearing protein precursor [Acinetobacter stercoris]